MGPEERVECSDKYSEGCEENDLCVEGKERERKGRKGKREAGRGLRIKVETTDRVTRERRKKKGGKIEG
jgi:hypothetical protein